MHVGNELTIGCKAQVGRIMFLGGGRPRYGLDGSELFVTGGFIDLRKYHHVLHIFFRALVKISTGF